MDIELASKIDDENPVVGDIRLVNGTPRLTPDLKTQVAQKLRIKFRFVRGEWFRNRREGVPWFTEILGVKPFPQERAEAILQQVLTGTAGIASITSFRVDFDPVARKASPVFEVRLADGQPLKSSDFGEFFVGP